MFLLLVIKKEGVIGWLSPSSPCSWVLILRLHPVIIIGNMLPTPGKAIFATLSIITCVWTNVFLITLLIICYITLSAHIFVFSHLITAEAFSATMDRFCWVSFIILKQKTNFSNRIATLSFSNS